MYGIDHKSVQKKFTSNILCFSWKRTANGDIAADREGKNVLQIVVVQRRDTHEWALPGVGSGTVDFTVSYSCHTLQNTKSRPRIDPRFTTPVNH